MKWEKKGSHIFLRMLARINALFALLMLLSYLAPQIPPDPLWPFGILGLAYPFLLLINGGFLIMWVILKKRYLLMPLLVILLGWNHMGNHLQIFPATYEEKPGQIMVMTYNAQLTQRHYQKKSASDMLQLMDSVAPDIICLQEFYYSSEEMQKFRKNLKDLANHRIANERSGSNLLIYTRYPSIKKGFLSAGGSTFALFSDIIAHGDTLRVYNIQLASNNLQDEKSLFDEQSDWRKKQSQQKATNIIKKLINGYERRTAEVKIMQEHIQNAPHPVIIGGDFNDTPLSYAYHHLKGNNLKDAFLKSTTAGMGNTHNENLPPIRIDFILHDKSYETLFYQRIDKTFSDHFGIVAAIRKQ